MEENELIPPFNRMSVLDSTKKLIGLMYDDDTFDVDVIAAINSVFASMLQMGIGPKRGIVVYDRTTRWDEYFEEAMIGMLQTYMANKVRMIFDPPTTSSLAEAYKKTIEETEFRLFIAAENSELLSPNKEVL